MEITVARKRLEEMRDDLDRSIAMLQGDGPGPVAGSGYPQDSADAGALLSEADRTEAILHSARGQRDEVLAALARIDENTYGRCADCGHEIPEGGLTPGPTPPAASPASPSGLNGTQEPGGRPPKTPRLLGGLLPQPPQTPLGATWACWPR